MSKPARQYLLEFGVAMAAYTLLLPLSVLLVDEAQPIAVRALIAALPVLPLLFAYRAYLRFVSRADELQQRIQLQALALAGGITGLTTFTYGLLVENAGLPALSLIWVFPLFISIWGIATAVLNWRFR